MLVLLYGWFAFTRTPWYVHRYLTPPYEAEAKEFFETNRSTFKYLAQCFEDWSTMTVTMCLHGRTDTYTVRITLRSGSPIC